MAESKYTDNIAISNVIGGFYNNVQLLDLSDKYKLNENDFPNDFYKIVFCSIFKLYNLGSTEINL